MSAFKVWARWRPLEPIKPRKGEIQRQHAQHHKGPHSCISIALPLQATALSSRDLSWKSGFSFDGVFGPEDNNHSVFNRASLRPSSQRCYRAGHVTSAYDHSGSGKSHTMIGYDLEHNDEFGLCLAAAQQVSIALGRINVEDGSHRFGIGLRVYELRKNRAFDLLNNRNECFVREGSDRRAFIRGETEMLENGKMRVRPIATRACWSFE